MNLDGSCVCFGSMWMPHVLITTMVPLGRNFPSIQSSVSHHQRNESAIERSILNFTKSVWKAERKNRSPSMAFLYNHVDVRQVLHVIPDWRASMAHYFINLHVGFALNFGVLDESLDDSQSQTRTRIRAAFHQNSTNEL